MTNKTAATRYARALLDVVVQEKGNPELVEQEVAAFVDLFNRFPALAKSLLNPAVPVPRKRAAVAELTRLAKTSPTVAKLLGLLAERDRLVLLPDLLAAYRDRLLEYRKVVRADITTAAPVPPDRVEAIQRKLAQLSGRTVVLNTRVDGSIIGGVVARIGSTVYDGSVTRQLQRMKERLVESV